MLTTHAVAVLPPGDSAFRLAGGGWAIFEAESGEGHLPVSPTRRAVCGLVAMAACTQCGVEVCSGPRVTRAGRGREEALGTLLLLIKPRDGNLHAALHLRVCLLSICTRCVVPPTRVGRPVRRSLFPGVDTKF